MKIQQNGAKFVCHLPKDMLLEDFKQLGSIPGLTFNPDERIAVGMRDAAAVVARRLNSGVPETALAFTSRISGATKELGAAWRKSLLLRDYQQQGILALKMIQEECGGALLADEMGLGKTRQAIALALLQGAKSVLIVCPAFVRETWAEELKGLGQTDILLVKPGYKRSGVGVPKWRISSYELAQEAANLCWVDFLIMDEAHYVKGRKSQRSKALEEIAALVPRKLALTATPMWSRPRDFYQMLKVLFGGRRFGSSYEFDMRYCQGTINEWGGMQNNGLSNEDELRFRLSYYMVRREKREVAKELPSLTRQVLWVDSEIDQALMWKVPLKAVLKAKMPAAVELAVNAKRFVLFTWLKQHVGELQAMIASAGTPCFGITGDMSHEERHTTVKAAQAEGAGLVATIDSMGTGVNLQGVASIGIMHSLDWVPLKMAQAEARLHRLGQTEPVQWHYLALRNSPDEVIIQNIIGKLDQFRATLNSTQGARDLRYGLSDAFSKDETASLKALYDALPEE